jgi:hypothetical protein
LVVNDHVFHQHIGGEIDLFGYLLVLDEDKLVLLAHNDVAAVLSGKQPFGNYSFFELVAQERDTLEQLIYVLPIDAILMEDVEVSIS